jgi:hypothetical protein
MGACRGFMPWFFEVIAYDLRSTSRGLISLRSSSGRLSLMRRVGSREGHERLRFGLSKKYK